MAFGGGGPHFCLGANLARMEIRVMFDRLLDRVPDIRQDGDVQRLRSNFINGVKHIPVGSHPLRTGRAASTGRRTVSHLQRAQDEPSPMRSPPGRSGSSP